MPLRCFIPANWADCVLGTIPHDWIIGAPWLLAGIWLGYAYGRFGLIGLAFAIGVLFYVMGRMAGGQARDAQPVNWPRREPGPAPDQPRQPLFPRLREAFQRGRRLFPIGG